MKEGKILEYFINNQGKPKSRIAEDLGMSRKNLYDVFNSNVLKRDTKEKFEHYFNTKIFTQEYKKAAEEFYKSDEQAALHHLKEDASTYAPISDYLGKYVNQLEQHNKDLKEYNSDLKYIVEAQKKEIARLENAKEK